MSDTAVPTRGSLKRKLEDSEADLPNSKRQKLNDDKLEDHKKVSSVSDASSTMMVDGSTLNPLSDHHVSALHDTLHTLRATLKEDDSIQHAENVLTDLLITQLAQFAPISLDHLTHFDALNDAPLSTIGDKIISVIADYIRSHALQSPFQMVTTDPPVNTTHAINGSNADQKDDVIPDSTCTNHETVSECITESENTIRHKQIRKKKKRFIDSESEDEDNDMCATASNTTKFVYGDNIETIGHKIPDIMDENEEPSEEEQDDDLDGFVVADDDEDDAEEDGHTFHRRVLTRHIDVDSGEEEEEEEDDAFFIDVDSAPDVERLVTHDDSDDSVVIMSRRSTLRNHNHNPDTPVIEDEHDGLERLDTTDSLRPQLLRFYSDDMAAEAMEDDIEDMDGEEIQNEMAMDECEGLSDGESLNSIDDEIDREIFGIDDVRFADLSLENAVKRQSLVDMIKIFENGMDIKQCSFWFDYGDFMKIFNDKCTKAMRLISVLFPLGFGNETQSGNEEAGVYDPTLFALVPKRDDMDDIPIDEHLHPLEYEFMKCIRNEAYYGKVPGLLLGGVSPNVVPKFFVRMEEFRMVIIRKWFDAITFQNIDVIKEYHRVFGIPIDLNIPRKLIKHVLQTDFEHLQGATGLVIASLVGALEIVKYCVAQGADIECKTSFGNDTALMFASKRGNLSVVEYLCDQGADINATTTQSEAYADTPSPVAFEALIHKRKEVLQYLTYYGADLYLMGPNNSRGEKVSVMRLCLMENKYGLNEIKKGLKQRFDFIKQCLSQQFVFVDIDIMSNIAFIICDEFLNAAHDEYLTALKYEYMIDWD